MPDLDQLLNGLVDDVQVATRPPGAVVAIARARRRRTGAVVAAVAVLAAGTGLAVGALGGEDRKSSLVAPPRPSPAASLFQEPADVEGATFRNGIRKALASAPGWSVTPGADPTVLHPCAGEWSVGETGGSGGTISLTETRGGPRLWANGVGFPSAALAAEAVNRLARNLEACTSTSWTTARIGRRGAVLASSSLGVAWIQQEGVRVSTLEMPTKDGAPPLAVQVEVSDLMHASTG